MSTPGQRLKARVPQHFVLDAKHRLLSPLEALYLYSCHELVIEYGSTRLEGDGSWVECATNSRVGNRCDCGAGTNSISITIPSSNEVREGLFHPIERLRSGKEGEQ